MKSVIVNLRDGSKEVKVGDLLYISGRCTNRPCVVTSIGRKYIYLDRIKIDISNGIEPSEYSNSAYAYSSESSYKQHTIKHSFINNVKRKLQSYGLNLDYDQAIKINELLDLKVK